MPALLSLAHLTVLKAHPLDLIELAAGAGFDAIGLRIWAPTSADTVEPVIDRPDLQIAIRRRLRDTGIRLHDVEAFWLLPDSDLARMRRAYEVGAELGARHVVLTGNDTDQARLIDNFGRTCADAAACGLVPMLEFIPYTTVRSLADAQALRLSAGADGAGILVDALHLARSGGAPGDLATYPTDLFRYLHLCDAPAAAPADTAGLRREARTARLYPGEGDLWLADLIGALPADTPIAVEAPTARHAGLSLAEQASLAAAAARSVIEQTRQRGG